MPKFSFFKRLEVFNGLRPPPKDMGEISNFENLEWGQLPKDQVINLIRDINTQIVTFNTLETVEERIAALQKIQNTFNEFENQYPSVFFKNLTYFGLKTFILGQIHDQHAIIGLPKLSSDPNQPPSLSDIINFMSPDKSYLLLQYLDKGQTNPLSKLKNLYKKDDKSEEAVVFRNFLATHQISALAGRNSKNYKVTRLSDGTEQVLKIEYPGNPRNVKALLGNQESLKNKLPIIETERLAFTTAYMNESLVIKNAARIQVLPFHSGENLWEHSTNLYNLSSKLEKTGAIFEQMAQTLIDFNKAGVLFPDAKLTNWMIDKSGQISIIDTKAFLFAEQDGTVNLNVGKNQNYELFCTKGLRPPEFLDITMNADQVHSYLLGKNLYYYISLNFSKNEDVEHQGTRFDFDFPEFHTQQGQNYKYLIEQLVQPDPEKRMSMAEALVHLKYYNILAELDKLTFGKDDKVMQDYLESQKTAFKNTDLEGKQQIIENMSTTLKDLKNNPMLVELKNIANQFREQKTFFSIGMDKKSSRIEKAVCSLSLEERCDSSNFEQFDGAIRALASHRSLFNDGVVYEIEGQIDEKKAAQAFIDFKNTFKQTFEKPSSEKDAKVQPDSTIQIK